MKVNFTKRIFALFLTLLMVFSSAPMSVFAQEVITVAENTEITIQENVTEEITTEESTSEDNTTETPEPSFDGTGVASAAELEAALASGAEKICITASFEIDRTFYITHSVNIYSAEAHTLTRKADFADDIFVVGEAADGTVCTEKVTLSVGTAEEANSDILTIDGNKDNMTADVTGTVFFVCKNGQVDLQPDLTVKNCEKKGNVRALDKTKHTLCNDRTIIGGAVAIIAEAADDDPKSIADGLMNIYGGKYLNNGVVNSGLYGGAFFNHGKMYVYDGLFEGGYASRAGVFYNYRTMYIYKAMIQNNESTSMGGAVYIPASSGAVMYIGGDAAAESTQVVFKNNASKIGGAISNSGKLIMRNTLFESNSSTSSAGAVYGSGTYVNIAAYNCEFKLNEAGTNGGAIYTTGQRSGYNVDLDIRDSKFTENEAGESGGAVYAAGKSRTYVRDTAFSKNTAASGGGVFYVYGSAAEFNCVTFTENSTSASGGVLYMAKATEEVKDENDEKVTVDVPASVTMHEVTATDNSAVANGGVVYSGKGNLNVYNSSFKENTAKFGSAFYFSTSAEGDLYNCLIEGNACTESNTGNAGAIALVTGGTKVTLNTCTFKDNSSKGLGGAILVTGPSLLDLYNITATGNSADKGGFMYETKAGSVVTISGLTVSGNSATTGGPIIWGNTENAKLYINKNNYTDSDVTTALDDAYWADAIKNKLTVYDSDATVPEHDEYDQPDYDKTGTPDVKTAKQLEDAINAGFEKIRILQDFEIDRTYYITKNVQIYSEIPVTLKRKADFGGDIFVVGEGAEGTVCTEKVTLTVGTPDATTADMLTIDGNKENMTETVKGTVFFVGTNGQADLHPDLTVKNCEKKGNDRALDKEKYALSGSPKNVGGAVGIIADKGTEAGKIANAKGGIMNIYGGKYSDNGVSSSGVYGGAFFNHSKMYVYDGAFENGYASRAGAIYNYRTLYIYKARFENNSASSSGGAIYVPATSAGYLYIGQESADPVVYFNSNSAEYGGAVYMSGGKLTADSTVFSQNSAALGGALYVVGDYKTLSVNKSLFEKNTSTEKGSALYLSGGNTNGDRYILKANDTVFSENTAALSAAVYLKETSALLEGISFIGNTAAEDGGALTLCEGSDADMKNITATGNSASRGGFAAVSSSKLRVFDSSISQNTAVSGGAMFLGEGAETGVYNTDFISNEATDNGGALDISSGVRVVLQECTFDKNSAVNYGGALRASSASPVDIYNVTAIQNSAKQGGFMYETDAGTVVTLIGATVSGNTATDGGAFVWGNTAEATLNINKSKFTDSDMTTELDDAYWTDAIANELTVNYIDGDVPPYADFGNEEPGNMWNAVDVASADELETALSEGKAEIRITKDFEIDRTFYVTSDTVIFSTSYVTLTRKADFGGDIFVVGQASDGTVCDEQADLTVGNPESETKSLLIIDGNKNNMTADVKGTVFFVCANGHVNLYDNLTVRNALKNGNERTLDTVHGVSYPEYIGAAVGIIAKNATMDIYGGFYTGNGANESGKTSYGGAFYNFGVMNIYGGTFSKNRASRAGAFYNYRTLNIYKADITENYASSNGGAIYMPASTGAFLYIGQDAGTEDLESKVLFDGNSSGGNAGAIYANNVIGIKNTTFKSNKASDNGGAISSNSAVLTVEDSEFDSNTASDNGAAIYVSGKASKENAVELTANNTTFTSNTATLNGGAVYMKSEAQAYVGECLFDNNTAKVSTTDTRYGGGAVYMNGAEAEFEGTTFSANTSKYNGGAVVLSSVQKAVFTDIVADGNSADKDGGFLYATASSPKFYGGEIKNSSAAENGGAIALENGCETDIIKASLKGNSAVNGGALFVNTGDGRTLIHSSSLTENTATNGGAVMVTGGSLFELYNAEAIKNGASYGGVLYLSGDSSKARFNLITVSENTATVAGPIVYSDTAAAVLDINKDKFTDSDMTTELDSAYWSSAIAGELTVQENDEKTPGYAEIGNESFGYLWDAVDVSTADELEAALTAGKPHIRVTADFDLDRTFTVRSDAVIFSTKAHKLTRAAGFGGVIFAVTTQAADKATVFGLGNSVSETENLLTIDGNKDNMTVEVTGAVIDAQKGTKAEIYKNITLTSCSATPIINRGEAEINGGIFTKNTSAENGGVIYNEGTLVITAGEFISNTALNGGAVYNAGALTAEGGAFTSNKAQTNGGAICNTGTLYIGKAVFTSNNATENGGAIATDKTLTADEAAFTSNKAKIGGAIYIAPAADKTASLIINSAVFSKNTAEKGGAVGAERVKLTVTADFEKNTATNGGAVYMFPGCDGDFTGVSSASDSAKENGGFLYSEGSAASFLDCTVDSASAVKSGAAAYIGNGGSLDVISSEFTGGKAQMNGGAIALYGETITAKIDKSRFDGNSAVNGGAVYKNDGGQLVITDSSFKACTATNGGAVYSDNGETKVSSSEFTSNAAQNNGGAIAFERKATATLYGLTAESNKAENSGGFLYTEDTVLSLEYSDINSNTAKKGGALALEGDTVLECAETDFVGNRAQADGGAVYVKTDGTTVKFNKCSVTSNIATGNGGAFYICSGSEAELYNTTAAKNEAAYGAVLYITNASTEVIVNGMTVSGNKAKNSGYIIYGNSSMAVLRINKANHTDKDEKSALNDAYWKKAIAGSIKVKEMSDKAPDYSKTVVKVKTAAELEAAINKDAKNICIVADFKIDRTYYIKSDVTIYSTEPHTLTRAENFGGDFFVVGETSKGRLAYLDSSVVKLTVGHPLSEKENLLIIDGNKDKMKTTVKGSIFFVSYGAQVELNDNLTVTNCYKQYNERAHIAEYKISRPNRVGGSVAIIANGILTVNGGNYKYNRVNDEDTSSEEGRNSSIGGVFYNNSNLIVRGGNFIGNQAGRGGIVYNYKIVKFIAGTFRDNAAKYSAVYYSPSSAGIHLLIGSYDKDGEKVLFKNNTSKYGGSVVTSSHFSAVVVFGNASFKNNTVTSGNGGVISTTSTLTVKNSEFIGNKASGYGGAVYFSRSDNDEITRLGNIENCLFESNQAKNGGAVATNSSAVKNYSKGSISTIESCTFRDNLSTSSGGALYSDNLSKVTVNNCLFEKNKSNGEAGAMYLIGKSNLTLNNNRFIGNTAASHGGAISARSVTLNINGNEISGNTAKSNGGAIYVSYSSAMDINTHLTLDGTVIKNNQASNGGAIYATRRAIEENAILINAKNVVFEENKATSSGGAILLTAGIKTYFNNITFNKNSAKNGGAVSVGSKSLFELDKATFTSNTSTENGGALSLGGSGTALMNNVSTSGNKGSSGGFVYSEGGILKLYNSKINSNTAYSGGAMYLYTGAVSNIYNTEFNNNKTYLSASGSTGNGGALFVYTGGTQTLLHTCKFSGNETTGTGGAMYVSGESNAKFYNLTASGNKAVKGGFMYETKAGTVVDIVGLTVSGNSASDGGPIIWGNTLNAVLNLDKSKYSDTKADVSAAGYWSTAIVNKLTVKDISSAVAKADTYVSKKDETKPASTKTPVSVEDVFKIAKKSSDADINANYNKLKKLDNSSNFMSRSTAKYPKINGKTVTVDTFVYPTKGKTDNGIVGLGILLYQSLLYKKANPKEEVYIDISSYRFSVQSAVNLNRNGRYFGYMRDLVGKEYDEYGFVRLSYLLITAAKMGIHVNVIGHIDAYPRTKTEPTFYKYFTQKLSDPCDPKYAKGKVIGDYLDFNQTDWTLDAKGGTDMMHTKMAAVSHYLDMNGVAHRNAVWSSSSNLDGVKADGQNANWKLQTALLITNHDEIYRVTTNYLRLISSLTGQEEIIEFQDIVNSRSTEQIDLINAGRSKEIPADEQLVYLGTSKDKVFELYFTPFGGSAVAWDEVYNPYCKYLREMYESEDYILFAYNAAEYSGKFVLGRQMEEMIIRSFHENRNVKNKIYSYMEGFDSTTFDDLKVGKDIGYKSFYEKPFGSVHNKDMQLSYVKDGQRYFVTLHNSCNFHSGSMSYQSNFMIVIKEKSCAENGVFSTIARYSTTGDIAAHSYGDIKTVKATSKKDGYTYRECIYCGEKAVIDTVHKAGDWIVDKKATETENGVRYKKCVVCSDIVKTEEIARKEKSVDIAGLTGREFDAKSYISVDSAKVPLTIEARVRIPENVDGKTGVIVGNYSKSGKSIINIEGAEKGRIRLYIKNGKKVFDYTFKKDIRSYEPADIAVVFSSGKAILYVNGVKAESVKLKVSLPSTVPNLRIGGDNRSKNTQYFKGRIYAVHLFSKVRSASNIKKDRLVVSPDASNLIYSGFYTGNKLKSIPVTTELGARTFSAKNRIKLEGNLPSTPKTIEATISLPKSVKGRGGVIFGNYDEDFKSPLNLEIHEKGRVRLYFKNKGKTVSHIFKTDIRSDTSAVNIAITLSGKKAVLYINGEKKETAKLAAAVPSATKKFCIGGDNRDKNKAYFKGKIYSVNLFSDVRTASEIERDAIAVTGAESKLMYSSYVTSAKTEAAKKIMLTGQTFAKDVLYTIPGKLSGTPHTIEATLQLSTKVKGEGGVIFGNYSGKSGNELNLSVVEKGRIKLYFTSDKTKVTHTFKTDIRTKTAAVNIAVTVKDKKATLFVNGVKKETATLKKALPKITGNFCIGGDNRKGNSKYFKGKIYSVNVFSDARTSSEVKRDMRAVIRTSKDKSLLYSGYFYSHRCGLAAIGKSHSEGSWKKRFSATSSESGAKYKECTVCGKNLEAMEIKKTKTKLSSVDYTAYTGKPFDENSGTVSVKKKLPGGDFTIEAMVHLSPEQTDRAGTIIGNYDGGKSDQLNIEAYTDGKIRLYYKVGGKSYTHTFKTDIRAKKKAHITLSVSGKEVDFYVNGRLKETYKAKKDLSVAFDKLKIGGDNREGGNYFAGQIYSVYIFDGARNKNQISVDRFAVPYAEQNIIYSKFFK